MCYSVNQSHANASWQLCTVALKLTFAPHCKGNQNILLLVWQTMLA